MVPNEPAARAKGAYIPQAVLGAQNPQNTSFDGSGSAEANPAGSDDYGKVDKGA